MDVAAIIDGLTHYRRLPVAAIEAARETRTTMAAEFVRIIENYPESPADGGELQPRLLVIFHLLGEWREHTAYQPIARLLRRPDIDDLIGDALTETAPSVLAAVFDGDPQPIYEIILDEGADEFARSMAFKALVALVREGLLPRTEVERFLVRCFTDLRPVDSCYAWEGWQEAIAVLGLAELKSQVKRVFDRGGIERMWLSYEDFEADLRDALDHPDAPRKSDPNRYRLFGDTIEVLSNWYGFSQEYLNDVRRHDRRSARQQDLVYAIEDPTSPFINPSRDVGRNDPCPCGSGKKYKKCCLN
jgi:hypothetical protein